MTDEQGKFTLKHRTGESGVENGKYKVVLSKHVKADGSLVGPEEDGMIVGSEHLPSKYTRLERTKITADVSDTNAEFSFDLKVKK